MESHLFDRNRLRNIRTSRYDLCNHIDGLRIQESSCIGRRIYRWVWLGASVTGILTGYFVDNYGWNYGFYFWISGALIATVLMSFLCVLVKDFPDSQPLSEYDN